MLMKVGFELRRGTGDTFLKKEVKIVFLGNCKEVGLWMTVNLNTLEISFFAKDLKMKPHSQIALFPWYPIISHSLSSNYC